MNIVITGGTRGIGFGLVKYFLANGHSIAFSGTKQESIDNTVKKLTGDLLGVVSDVRVYTDIVKLYAEAKEKFGVIDVWINNAGVDQDRSDVADFKPENVDKVIDINVKGMINATSYVTSQMKLVDHGIVYNMEGLGSDGRMINQTILYGSSKRLLRYFSIGANKELKDTNVFVGRLSPGMVFTDLLLHELDDEALKIINILADDVETVTRYLGKNIEKGKKKIFWLSTLKILGKFAKAPFKKKK